MIPFLLIACFHGTKNKQSMQVIYRILHLYTIYVPQYPTRQGIQIMRGNLETRSDKSIFSNILCDIASIILKNNYFEIGQLKYHQKRGFAIGTKFASPYCNLFITWLEKRIFQNNEFKPFLWLQNMMKFLVYGPKVFKD